MDGDAMKRVLVMSALEALAWLTAKVARYATDYVWVTPEIAAAWLTKNTRNRKPITSRVEEWSRLMGEGRWITEADTVDKVDPEALARCSAAMAAMVYAIADMPEAPPR